MKNSNSMWRVKATLFIMAGTATTHLGLSSGLAEMAKHFSDATPTQIQLVSSIPTLVMLPVALLASSLVQYFSKKKIALFAYAWSTLFSLGPLFLDNLTAIIICRALVGLGTGLAMPTTGTILYDFFEGQERSKMMGFQSAFSSFGTMVWAFIGGLLANIHWRATFLITLATAISFIVVLFWLPDRGKSPKFSTVKKEGSYGKMLGTFLFFGGCMALFSMFYIAYTMNIAMYMDASGMGNATVSGLMTSIKNLGGFLMGLTFGWLCLKFKNFTIGWAYIGPLIGFSMLLTTHSVAVVVISSFLVGSGLPIMMSRMNWELSTIIPLAFMPMANAIVQSCNSLGNFLSPIVLNWAAAKFLPDTQLQRGVFTISLMGLGALAIGLLLRAAKNTRKGRFMPDAKSPDALGSEPKTEEA